MNETLLQVSVRPLIEQMATDAKHTNTHPSYQINHQSTNGRSSQVLPVLPVLQFLNFEPPDPMPSWLLHEISRNYQSFTHPDYLAYFIENFLPLPIVQIILSQKDDHDDIELPNPEPKQKQSSYLRTIYSLHEKQIIEVERPEGKTDPGVLFEKFSLVPDTRYTIDVVMEIGKLAKQGLSPQNIVNHLHEDYPVLKAAHISRAFVTKALKILEIGLLTTLPYHEKLEQPLVLTIDPTVRVQDDASLVVAVAVPLASDDAVSEDNESTRQNTTVKPIPVIVEFVPNTSRITILNLLTQLRGKLHGLSGNALDPLGVMADFAETLLPVVNQVFPEAKLLGCHFHFEELVQKVMIVPVYTELHKICSDFLKDLKKWAREYRWKRRAKIIEKVLAEVVTSFREGTFGRLGQNLIETLEKLDELKRRLRWVQRKYAKQYHFVEDLHRLLEKVDWKQFNKVSRQLKQRIHYFGQLVAVLRQKFESEELAKNALLQVVKNWQKTGKIIESPNNPNLENADWLLEGSRKIEKHVDKLVASMVDPRLPRATGALDGVHHKIKRTLRAWGGWSETPVTFNWAGQILTLLTAFDMDDFSKFNAEILRYLDANGWIEATLRVKKSERERRLILAIAWPMKRVKGVKAFGKAFTMTWEKFINGELPS